MNKSIFVVGTDTNPGKTLVVGLLGYYLYRDNYQVITCKEIQTGLYSDWDKHNQIIQREQKDLIEILKYKNKAVCYNFKFPASAHLSAKLENKTINLNKIKKEFICLNKKFDFTLMEGTGGVMTPISLKYNYIDLISNLNIPVIVVGLNKLGAINSMLLTIQALKQKKINILGMILNNVKDENEIILNDNCNIIEIKTKIPILGVLPFSENIEILKIQFKDIYNKIIKKIKYEK